MKKTLSDKEWTYPSTNEKIFFKEDVKEFIKELKKHFSKMPNRTFNLRKIDELAGEKLK